MRGWSWKAAVAGCLLATPAWALVDAKPQPTDAAAITESTLTTADSTTQVPPHWTGDFVPSEISSGDWPSEQPRRQADWVTRRLEQRRHFVQPLLFPPVQGTFLARLAQMGGWNSRNDSGELDQFLHLSAEWVELYAPVFTLREGSPFEVDRFRVNLRLPAQLGEHHAVALHLGTNLPVDGKLVDNGGFTTMAAYAFGSRLFSAQARAGFGYDQLIGDFEAPLRSSIFYDAVLAVLPVHWLQVMMQVDGQRFIGAPGNVLRLWPGVRLMPFAQPNFSLGLGAQVWLEDQSDDWSLRRSGAFVDFGWMFL